MPLSTKMLIVLSIALLIKVIVLVGFLVWGL
jgi:hypothetical protein